MKRSRQPVPQGYQLHYMHSDNLGSYFSKIVRQLTYHCHSLLLQKNNIALMKISNSYRFNPEQIFLEHDNDIQQK